VASKRCTKTRLRATPTRKRKKKKAEGKGTKEEGVRVVQLNQRRNVRSETFKWGESVSLTGGWGTQVKLKKFKGGKNDHKSREELANHLGTASGRSRLGGKGGVWSGIVRGGMGKEDDSDSSRGRTTKKGTRETSAQRVNRRSSQRKTVKKKGNKETLSRWPKKAGKMSGITAVGSFLSIKFTKN